MAEPAAFHLSSFEHRGVEQLAGPVVGLAAGAAAAGGECCCELQDLPPFAEAGVG